MPDALSRIPCEEIASLNITGPEVDLTSPCFKEFDYANLKEKVQRNQEKYPDMMEMRKMNKIPGNSGFRKV